MTIPRLGSPNCSATNIMSQRCGTKSYIAGQKRFLYRLQKQQESARISFYELKHFRISFYECKTFLDCDMA
jgi:hypothetical protein